MDYCTFVQPNGERIRLERWVYTAYLHGALTDLALLRPIRNAVRSWEGHLWGGSG